MKSNTTDRVSIQANDKSYFNGGNVGIGTSSPADSNGFGKALDIASGTGAALYLRDVNDSKVGIVGQFNEQLSLNSKQSDGNIGFYTGASNTERMRIDSSGNVGIGCVPNSIQSNFDTLQIGGNLTVNVDSTGAGAGVYMGNNVYRDRTNSRWEYIYTDEASQYYQANGNHVWRTASSGSANAAISWSENMRIDSSGNVGIGVTSIQSSVTGKTLETSGCLVVGGNLAAHQTNRGVFEYQGNVFQMRAYGASAGQGQITFRTGGGGGSSDSEAIRFGAAGQLGIGGANYGTSGQVLTSGGAGAAPSWVNGGSSTTYGAVGTYVLASRGSSTSSAGSTYAGSGLRPSGYSTNNSSGASQGYSVVQGGTTGSTLSGTWRAMGAYTFSIYTYKATLFVRIS